MVGLHAIIRLFAREELAEREDQGARREALERVLGGWLAMAEQMRRELYGGEFMALRGDRPRWQPRQGADLTVPAVDPMRWFEAESAHLMAAVGQAADERLDELCWDLAVSLVTLFEGGSYIDEWERTHERALELVRRTGNRRGEAVLLCSLGSLYISRRQPAALCVKIK